MQQADIDVLERRQKLIELELVEALRHASLNDPMVAYLKSRALYVKEEIERLRHEEIVSYH